MQRIARKFLYPKWRQFWMLCQNKAVLEVMKNSVAVWDIVEAKREAFFALSDRVWDMPETNYEEYRSAEEHAASWKPKGFVSSEGSRACRRLSWARPAKGGPVIAILGEFDALPGLSQEAAALEQRPLVPANGNGHGCGHNLLGAGSMLAAAAVKDYLAQTA